MNDEAKSAVVDKCCVLFRNSISGFFCLLIQKHQFDSFRDYRAEYEKLKAEKERNERTRQKDQISRLQKDVNSGGQGDMEGTDRRIGLGRL